MRKNASEALARLNEVGETPLRSILKDHGIEPAPERGKGMPWPVFLKAQWKALAASDSFTVEAWSWSGLVTYYVRFVMELATREVCIAGITTHPDASWMVQMARQPTDKGLTSGHKCPTTSTVGVVSERRTTKTS